MVSTTTTNDAMAGSGYKGGRVREGQSGLRDSQGKREHHFPHSLVAQLTLAIG